MLLLRFLRFLVLVSSLLGLLLLRRLLHGVVLLHNFAAATLANVTSAIASLRLGLQILLLKPNEEGRPMVYMKPSAQDKVL